MIEYGPGLDFLKDKLINGSITLVSSEKILLDANPNQWKKIIDTAFASEAMKERIKKEEQGVAQIKSGSYKWQ